MNAMSFFGVTQRGTAFSPSVRIIGGAALALAAKPSTSIAQLMTRSAPLENEIRPFADNGVTMALLQTHQ
jgi:hypothetical protein